MTGLYSICEKNSPVHGAHSSRNPNSHPLRNSDHIRLSGARNG